MELLRLLVSALAVWRVTHLLTEEDGPWDCTIRLRRRVHSVVFGGLLDCFYCLSIWVAVPFVLWISASWLERLILWPATSGAAILLERFTTTNPSQAETPTEVRADLCPAVERKETH